MTLLHKALVDFYEENRLYTNFFQEKVNNNVHQVE